MRESSIVVIVLALIIKAWPLRKMVVRVNVCVPPPATPHPPIARQRGGPYPTAWLP